MLVSGRREDEMKLLEERSGRLYDLNERWKLDDYLALPDDSRVEIVEGVLRPMARADTEGRQVQNRLAFLLEQQCLPGLAVAREEIVVFHETPPDARIPDVCVFERDGKVARTNHVAALHVLLVVEVVSPGSYELDRQVKPREYQRNGIPHLWRIELDPAIAVHTYVLSDEGYVRSGTCGPGDRIKSVSVSLGWVDVSVDQLLGNR